MELTCTSCGEAKHHREFIWKARQPGATGKCRPCREAEKTKSRELKAQGLRVCWRCKETKPVSEFLTNGDRGLGYSCKACNRAYLMERARKNGVPEKQPPPGNMETGFVCRVCNVLKPAEAFQTKNGMVWRYDCKECAALKQRTIMRTIQGQFSAAKNIAKQRGLSFELTFEQFAVLRTKSCHYCGWPLTETSTGLDRLDDTKGYLSENVVPCCWECNQARNVYFTPEEMKLLGAVIAQIKAARVAAGIDISPKRGYGTGRPRKYQDPQQ